MHAKLLIAVVFAATAVLGQSPSQDLNKRVLPEGPAKCLDGSQAAYYITRNPLSDVWVVYFQGGGYCVSPADCNSRLGTPLGTSNGLPETTRGIDQIVEIYNGDPVANPDFAYANRVYVPYCSGDGLLGQLTAPANPTWPFYFAGHHIIMGVLEDLAAQHGFGSKPAGTEKLILGGRSAGGIGVMQHLDLIASTYPTVSVAGYLNAAFFIDIDDYSHWIANPTPAPTPNLAAQNAQLVPMYYLFNAYVDADCAAANPTRPLYCIYAPAVIPHITAPMFFAEAFFDSFQIGSLHMTPAVFDANTLAYAGYFGTQMRALLDALPATTGLFGCSCFTHGVNFTTTVVAGQTLQQTFGNWYFSNGLPSHSLDGPVTPAGFSNPTCNAFPFGLQGPPDVFTDHGCVGQSAIISRDTYYVVSEAAYAPIATLTNPGAFTVSVWVKVVDADSHLRAIVSKHGTTGWTLSASETGFNFHLDFEGSGATGSATGSPTGSPTGSAHASFSLDLDIAADASQWNLVTVSYDGSSYARLTVNSDKEDATNDFGGFGSGAVGTRLYVGRKTLINTNLDYMMYAYIAEVGIWSRQLTNAEISKIYEGKSRDVDASWRVTLSYPITNTFAQHIRQDRSSFLFPARAPVVQEIPSQIADRCANEPAGLAAGQKK